MVFKFRWVIIFLGIALGVFDFMRAKEISQLTQPEDFLPRDYYINVAYTWVMNSFPLGAA